MLLLTVYNQDCVSVFGFNVDMLPFVSWLYAVDVSKIPEIFRFLRTGNPNNYHACKKTSICAHSI